MKKLSRNNIFLGLMVYLVTIVGCTTSKNKNVHLPYYQDALFTPVWMNPDDPRLDTFHQIASFNLTNQNGEQVTEKTFGGKIYIADFFFTHCSGICPKMTKNMVKLQDHFQDDKDVLLLSHSVTPQADSVPVLAEYAKNQGVISGKWHLVTGARSVIYDLGRTSYFVEEDLGLEKEDDDFLHTENFVLIDQYRHIRGIYNGLNKASLNQLKNDVVLLKLEMERL